MSIDLILANPLPIVIAGTIFLVVLMILLSRQLQRKRVFRYLHKSLPCSTKFPIPKSLFDILSDLGVSRDTFRLVDSFSWIPHGVQLDHAHLDTAVNRTLQPWNDYGEFVRSVRFQIQGKAIVPPPAGFHEQAAKYARYARSIILSLIQTDTVPVASIPSNRQGQQMQTVLPLEEWMEARQAFRQMILSLRDETKEEVAKRWGIVHRFDYLTSETFRSMDRSKDRHWAASLDFETYSNANLLLALGTLTGIAGAGLWGIAQLGEMTATVASSTAFDQGVESSTSDTSGIADSSESIGDTEGLGELSAAAESLSEVAIAVALVSLVVGGALKIRKNWRERHLRRYQEKVKGLFDELTAQFLTNGKEAAFRVPRMVLRALEIEEERLRILNHDLLASPLDTDKRSAIARVSLAAVEESARINARMLKKLQKDVEFLLGNIERFHKVGRTDLVGLHLYLNRELVFLPSHVPEKQFVQIELAGNKLLHEVQRLNKKLPS